MCINRIAKALRKNICMVNSNDDMYNILTRKGKIVAAGMDGCTGIEGLKEVL